MDNEQDLTLEKALNNAGRWFSKHIATIFAILISTYFIFSGTFQVLPTEMKFEERVIMTLITIIAGLSITKLIAEQGFTTAKLDSEFVRVKNEYNEAVKDGVKYRSAIEEFAKDKARENLKETRLGLCESVGLYYYDIFNEYGEVKKDFDITIYSKDSNYRKKISTLNKIIHLRIQDTSVFSASGSSKFGLKKRKSIKAYKLRKGITSAITKVILSFCSVSVMFVFIGWSAGAIIYAFMQVAIWCGTGVVERIGNFNFVINEILPQIENDRDIIKEFMAKSEEDKIVYINKANDKHKKILALPYRENTLQNENK